MPRYCFQLQVRPDRLDEYRERHRAVWPDMLAALRDTGWRNYSLFLRSDGLLIGYVEADDLAAAQQAMAATEVNARWQAEMQQFFTGLDGRGPDETFLLLDEVFHLEDQLAHHGTRAHPCAPFRIGDHTMTSTASRPAVADGVKKGVQQLRIETPSWGYANSGTRFKVFAQPGVPRSPEEKIADAAVVHRLTGAAPSVALHIPWDRVDDYGALAAYAADQGVALGTINANVFQDDDYKLGSVTNPDPRVRRKAIDHLLECVDIMDATGSRDLKLWFSDGTNYPGQDSIRARQDRLTEALRETYDRLGEGQRLILEYKLFEPAFYTTDVPDWGTAFAHCLELGPRAQVCIDTGHHAPGTNIEFIVAFLLRAGKLGAFDFNSRFYADDDLMVGAADPFQLFRILHEIVQGGALDPALGIAYMLDQCHNIEQKIPAIIRSVMNVQEATAKALLVDADALATAQRSGDVLGANAVLMDAYNTDVRPLLAQLREEVGLDPDPIAAYHRSGYQQQIERDRVGGQQAGWGA